MKTSIRTTVALLIMLMTAATLVCAGQFQERRRGFAAGPEAVRRVVLAIGGSCQGFLDN
ncbi:MAG: hypothetical protein AABO58_19595 [Acidobacteriota bacterium]